MYTKLKIEHNIDFLIGEIRRGKKNCVIY